MSRRLSCQKSFPLCQCLTCLNDHRVSACIVMRMYQGYGVLLIMCPIYVNALSAENLLMCMHQQLPAKKPKPPEGD